MQYKCRIGIEHHQILNLNDISLNGKFMARCSGEITDHCADKKTKLEVVYCLSEIVLNDTLMGKEQRLRQKCRDQVRFELLQFNENINLDPELAGSCENDIGKFCSGVKAGKGELLECLRSNMVKVEAACKAKLFKRVKIGSVDEKVHSFRPFSCFFYFVSIVGFLVLKKV